MIYNSTEEFLEIYSLQPKGSETSLVYESLNIPTRNTDNRNILFLPKSIIEI